MWAWSVGSCKIWVPSVPSSNLSYHFFTITGPNPRIWKHWNISSPPSSSPPKPPPAPSSNHHPNRHLHHHPNRHLYHHQTHTQAHAGVDAGDTMDTTEMKEIKARSAPRDHEQGPSPTVIHGLARPTPVMWVVAPVTSNDNNFF